MLNNIYYIFLCLFILLASCTSLQNNKDNSTLTNISAQDITLFQDAFNNLGQKNYYLAIPIFKTLAHKYRGLDLEQAALYNLASAYKELNKCKQAQTIYQKLMSKIATQKHLKARVFLSLSYVFECQGQPENTLMALRDGLQYIKFLDRDVRLIEYPARLALAYIRVNEKKTGLKMQKTVYQNMEDIKNKFYINTDANKHFSKYFYTIGRSHIVSEYIKLSMFLKIFSYYQVYLTQAIILNAGLSSVHAEQELGNLYRKVWVALKKHKDKTQYKTSVIHILDQLQNIARDSKNKKLYTIYNGLKQNTKKLFLQ